MTSAVPIDVRLRLTHGLLELLARAAGAQMLHIKGEALHPVLAQGRGQSTDCDVLVHPDHVSRFLQSLRDAGWEQYTSFEHGSVFEHAATYYHPVWGTVDVHRHFPGLHRDPAETFRVLWAARTTVELGSVQVSVPDLLGQRLILLVHAARGAASAGAGDRRRAWDLAAAEHREQVDALAESLGARVPLAIATDRVELVRGEPELRVWLALSDQADPTEVWVNRLLEADGLRKKLRVGWRALHVNPDHLTLRLGHPPSRGDMRREWWSRLGRGGRRLIAMARTRFTA